MAESGRTRAHATGASTLGSSPPGGSVPTSTCHGRVAGFAPPPRAVAEPGLYPPTFSAHFPFDFPATSLPSSRSDPEQFLDELLDVLRGLRMGCDLEDRPLLGGRLTDRGILA